MKPNLFLRLALGAGFVLLNQAVAQTIEVTSTGLGIGTSTPVAKLDVTGSVFVTNRTVPSAGAGLEAFYSSGSFLLSYDRTNSLYKPLAFDGSDIEFNISGSEKMRIASNGNVGIGTNTPATMLHIKGGNAWAVLERGSTANVAIATFANSGNAPAWALGLVDTSDAITFFNYATSSYALSILANGNVGIGTSDPGADLHLRKTTAGYVAERIENFNSGSSSYAMMIVNAYGNSWGMRVGTAAANNNRLDFIEDALDVKTPRLSVLVGGNVGIGTTSPGYKLEVSGSVRATSFIANSATYADFVFKPGYKLAPLSEVEAAIQTHGHLPDIPSEAEAKAHGIDLAAMQVKLLQKMEEVTLYLVAHDKELKQLRAENETLRRQLSALEKR